MKRVIREISDLAQIPPDEIENAIAGLVDYYERVREIRSIGSDVSGICYVWDNETKNIADDVLIFNNQNIGWGV